MPVLRFVLLFLALSCGPLAAQEGLIRSGATSLLQSARPLVEMAARSDGEQRSASLFQGARTGMFAPVTRRDIPDLPGTFRLPMGGSDVAQILSVIAQAEAGRMGYDAVIHSARIKTPRRPTQMTIGEIYDWIHRTPKQQHAIGRYQFIPKTLKRLVKAQGLSLNARFSPQVQDQLAHQLLQEAGLSRFKAGRIDRRAFMGNLSKIWAGLPLPSGKSYYQGYAGNKATMSWASFDRAMKQIYPHRI
jgi:hypothetical protein